MAKHRADGLGRALMLVVGCSLADIRKPSTEDLAQERSRRGAPSCPACDASGFSQGWASNRHRFPPCSACQGTGVSDPDYA